MIWKKIKGFERYEVSDEGDVRSIDMEVVTKDGFRSFREGRMLKKTTGKNDYWFVHLSYSGNCRNRPIHRLVAETFVPNPDNLPIVDHIDGDKHNNKASNLRWVDAKTNKNNPATRTNGQRKRGEFHHTEETKQKIRLFMIGRPSPRKGVTLSDEAKEKISRNRKGKVGRKRGVLQFDLEGNLINEWDNISEAIRQNNLTVGSANPGITKCCQGKVKQAYGFVWKYKTIN